MKFSAYAQSVGPLFKGIFFADDILQSIANAIAVLMFAVGSAAWRVSNATDIGDRCFGGEDNGTDQP
jgi:hypothetical protein